MGFGKHFTFESEIPPTGGPAPLVRVRLKTFEIPPIQDGAVVGKKAPMTAKTMAQTLGLVSHEAFLPIEVDDPVVGAIFVRESVLLKVSAKAIREFVLQRLKPIMADTEMLALHLEVEIALQNPF